ncbi:hypothetical protein M3Y98_00438600 [Aphelenchoides besseyi]|nr:hypothetical protein M3Y98_00438600 [Aphelenchoides besseyi]KAI6202325.1 hypothetical protein M3Y96_00936400 [Aphelenchoides besseyi]
MIRLLVFILLCASSIATTEAAPFTTEFKCAGDNGRTCESGFCYDALIMPEGTQEAGCATEDQCTEVGCFMASSRFTCCCARNRFCNGKSNSLMWSKFRIFRNNGDSWPTFVPPRLFARNVTTESPKPKIMNTNVESKDIRLAPPRRTTETTPQTREPKKVVSNSQTPQTTTTRTSSTFADSFSVTTTIPLDTSTTTEFAVLSSSSTLQLQTTQKFVQETTGKQSEVKLTTVTEETKKLSHPSTFGFSIVSPNESERTTRSYTSTSSGSSTTKRKFTTQSPPRIETITAVHKSEVNYPRSFPWWYITIAGFVISLIIFALIYVLIRKYRQRQRAVTTARNSVDSSQLSDAQPNDSGTTTADPLLLDKTN